MYYIKNTAILLLAVFFAGCSLLNTTNQWNYDHPPKLNSEITIPDGGVWCRSLDSAKFMATTGWFAPDCTNEPFTHSQAKVTQILPFFINGVSMLIVRATDAERTYWIPLPDHNWS